MFPTKILINVLVGILFLAGLFGLVFKAFTMEEYLKYVKAVTEFLVPLIIAYGVGKGAQEVADRLKKPEKEE